MVTFKQTHISFFLWFGYPYKNQICSFILIVFMVKLFNLVTDFVALLFLLVLYTLAVIWTQTVIHFLSISRQFPVPI